MKQLIIKIIKKKWKLYKIEWIKILKIIIVRIFKNIYIKQNTLKIEVDNNWNI